MNTRDRILETSLALFNEEGERALSSVDIANEVGLSPGNLYYHFKGKDAIIRALFERHEEELRTILAGSADRITTIEDCWIYLCILLEEAWDIRFLYRDLADLAHRYGWLGQRMRALLRTERQVLSGMLRSLEAAGVLAIEPKLRAALADQILLTLTFWLAADAVEGPAGDGRTLIGRTVCQIMTLLLPHMHDDTAAVIADLEARLLG